MSLREEATTESFLEVSSVAPEEESTTMQIIWESFEMVTEKEDNTINTSAALGSKDQGTRASPTGAADHSVKATLFIGAYGNNGPKAVLI